MLVNTYFQKWPLQFFKNIYIVNIRGLEPRLRKMICSSTCLDVTRCFREEYTGLPVVHVTENQKALNCVVLNHSIPVSEG